MYMQIFVTNTQGNIRTLAVDSDSTIDMVKRMLQNADPGYIAWLDKKASADWEYGRKLILQLRGKPLEDSRQLADYKIDKESTLLPSLNGSQHDAGMSCKHCGAHEAEPYTEPYTEKDKINMCFFRIDPVFKRSSDGKCTTCVGHNVYGEEGWREYCWPRDSYAINDRFKGGIDPEFWPFPSYVCCCCYCDGEGTDADH